MRSFWYTGSSSITVRVSKQEKCSVYKCLVNNIPDITLNLPRCVLLGRLLLSLPEDGHLRRRRHRALTAWHLEEVRIGHDQRNLRLLWFVSPSFPDLYSKYREVQLDLTPEIEVFHMLFQGCHTKNRKSPLKQYIKYLKNLKSKIPLDHPVVSGLEVNV